VEIPNSPDLNSKTITISTWVNAANLENIQPIIFNKEEQYELAIFGTSYDGISDGADLINSNDLAVAANVTSNTTWVWRNGNASIVAGKNYHIVFTFDSNFHGKVYVNGVLKRDIVYSSSIVSTSNCLRIGARGCNGDIASYFFNGLIDETSIYNRALSETEVKSLYAGVSGISGNINGVQKYSAVCKNTKTSVTKKIAVADGAKEWNCKTAGLQTKKGDIVTVTITGVSQ
jgi:hypothetical protein